MSYQAISHLDRRKQRITACIPRMHLQRGKLIADIIDDRRGQRITTCVIQKQRSPDILFLQQFRSQDEARSAAEQFFFDYPDGPPLEQHFSYEVAEFAMRSFCRLRNARSTLNRCGELLRGTRELIRQSRALPNAKVFRPPDSFVGTASPVDAPRSSPTLAVMARRK